MKQIQESNEMDVIFSQMNNLLESRVGSDANSHFLESFDAGNDFESFTDNLLEQFVQKSVIYEPLKET